MWTSVCEGSRARTPVYRLPLMAAAVLGWLVGPPSAAAAHAQSFAQRLQLRSSVAGSLMVSRDQRGYLDYRSPGALGDLQLEYAALPWLSLQLGAAGGVFFSSSPAGGLVAPMLGVMGRYPLLGWTPYLALDGGAGFTGKLLRPFARGRIGADFPISSTLRIGPALGLDVVFQRNGADDSTDAVYPWLGVSLSFQPSTPRRQVVVARVHLPPKPVFAPHEPAPPVDHPPAAPSPELTSLLDEAVHVERSELLAPVLFAFDSDELDANGIAMLHQVASLLTHERKDITRLAIAAYADARGSSEYNRDLSRRRAERVRAWLIAHGVAAERLEIDAEGASHFVEPGNDESEHQQNRRVVFRVLATEAE
jgi:outer membrane protein OmpA-like peptidoglycan-associated protein